jgi:hypothetical protein
MDLFLNDIVCLINLGLKNNKKSGFFQAIEIKSKIYHRCLLKKGLFFWKAPRVVEFVTDM